MKASTQKGFALVMCLLLLPFGLFLYLVCRQILFFNYVKNEILQDCFTASLIQVENVIWENRLQFSEGEATADLQRLLTDKFLKLTNNSKNDFFKLKLKFNPTLPADMKTSLEKIESSVNLQLGVMNRNSKFKNFEQRYRCGAYLKWKESKKFYGITAVRF